MKTYVNHIKGKQYVYAYDSIFVARGKTIQKTKSFGPLDALANFDAKKRTFELALQKEEVGLRTRYWKEKVCNPKFLKYASLEKIENLRSGLYRAKKDMGKVASDAMERAFLIDFIYNSNKLEGSKVPRESVEKQVSLGQKKSVEVQNSLRALYQVSTKSFHITPIQIQKLHDVLLEHEPENRGFRTGAVVVGESSVSPWEKVKEELALLCEWYEKAKNTMYPPELAFDFYYRFERIHPFMDGNGRMGRLLMNRILKDQKYHPMIIWNKRRKAHMAAFAKRMESREEYYYKFMEEQFTKTHEIYLKKIEKAVDYEKLTRLFNEPSEYNS